MSDQNNIPPAAPASPWMAHALKPGSTIMEYVIERTLGGGGFGITYLARDKNLDLPVAVKEYLPGDLAMRAVDGSVKPLGDAFGDQFQWGLERFLTEARVLATFRHPNIVRALRYFPANGTAYIVMEFESGDSLNKWRPRQEAFTQSSLLKLINPLLDGLEMIHSAGFLHRDIKPDNIYVRSNDTPVLIDFGSARSTNTDADMTSIVTPGFAPFEQYQSKGNQGPWTDLYSLAAVMYWLISGVKPVNSIERMKQDSMVSVTQLDRHKLIDAPLLKAIDWALNPDETQRPQSVAEFRSRLLSSAGEERTVRVAGGQHTSAQAVMAQKSSASTVADFTTTSGRTISATEIHSSNLVCSILFLDIIAYSKTSVNEQYQLKSNFNQLIAGKLAHVPDNSRITLDTGDGAAICFMGDPEEVLYSAMDIQRTLALQDRLFVRMGLHIGPVRILNDLNGHNNVIGDGINVAQRVMSFADTNSLVVSRAFYEIAACLTDGGEQNFSYLGERRDKHERIHEIYAVITGNEAGRLDDQTIRLNDTSITVASNIAPDMLASLEKELAQHLGPLSAVLIRKLKARAASEADLRTLLAQSITNPAQREAFLLAAETNSRKNDHVSTQLNTLHSQNLTSNVSGNATQNSGSTVSAASAVIPPWLTQDCRAMLEKILAKTIGPMARVLVKNEMRKADNIAKLTEALAMHIDSMELRSKFLKEVTSLRND